MPWERFHDKVTANQHCLFSIFMGHPASADVRDFWFTSVRTSWARAHLDPPKAGKYWRSVIGSLGLTAAQWRAGG